MATNPSCVRAIPYNINYTKGRDNPKISMCLYMDTAGQGITDDLREGAKKIFAGYVLKFVDVEHDIMGSYFTESELPRVCKEMVKVAQVIEKNLHIFENRLNVTAVYPSYNICDARETNELCITISVLGKGKIPVGEEKFSDAKLGGYPLDIVEGYFAPTAGPNLCKVSPLHFGVGIGVKGKHGAGTLGAFLTDGKKYYALSCQHVLFKEGQPAEAEQPAEEKPAERQPVKEKPAEEKPVERQPVKEKPAEEKPAEEKPAEEKPAERQPVKEKPAEEKPAEEKPVERQPVKEKPAEEKPAEEKPAERQPVKEKPAEEKPAEEKPAERQPVKEKPAEEKPVERQPVKEKPAEEKPAEEKPAERQPVKEKPAEEKPAEEKPAERQPAERQPAEEKPAEEKPAEEKPAERQPVKEKPAEEKPAERQPVKEKPAEEKPAERQPVKEHLAKKQLASEDQLAEKQPAEKQPAEKDFITRKEKGISVKKKRLRELREKNHSNVHEDDKEKIVDEITKIKSEIQQEAAELDFINGKIRLENCILEKRDRLTELNERQQGNVTKEIKEIESEVRVPNQREILIEQPAAMDFISETNDLQKNISEQMEILEELKKKDGDLEGSDKWKNRSEIELAELEVKRSTKQLENCMEYGLPRCIGTYSFGFQSNHYDSNYDRTFFVDAAVAEIDDDERDRIQSTKKGSVFGFGWKNEIDKNGDIVTCDKFETEAENAKFWKSGRTTGHTKEGRFRRAHVFINREGFKKDVCYGEFTNVPFCTYCKTCGPKIKCDLVETTLLKDKELKCKNCKKAIFEENEKSELWAYNCFFVASRGELFSSGGDSGAVIFDQEGRAWGIIVGSFSDQSYINTVAISLEIALKALNEKFGTELKLWCVKPVTT